MRNCRVWMTAEGIKIPIKKMLNSHLVNTINYLRRTGAIAQIEGISSAYSAANCFSEDSMASYFADHDIMLMEQETLDDFLLRKVPQYCSLLAESEKRNLKIEEIERL